MSSEKINSIFGKHKKLILIAVLLIISLVIIVAAVTVHNHNKSDSVNDYNVNDNYNNSDSSFSEDSPSNASTKESLETTYGSGFNKEDGPILVKKDTSGGNTIKVCQYMIDSKEIKQIYTFNLKVKYFATYGFNIDVYGARPNNCSSNFQYAQQFSSDFSKMAIMWDEENDGEHVGYMDSDGNVTDVTSMVHEKTTGFTSVLPNDSFPLFTSNDELYFADYENKVLCYYDINQQKIIKKLNMDDYGFDSRESIYPIRGLNADDMPIIDGYIEKTEKYKSEYGADYILYNNHYINLKVDDNHIVAWGSGFGKSTRYPLEKLDIFNETYGQTITPDSEYRLTGDIACYGNTVYFSATRDKEKSLFSIEFKNGSFTEPKLIGNIEGFELAFCKK